MLDMSNYSIYTNKDGRIRAYNKTTHKVVSYPRVLMEMKLGRQLLPTEDVHHKDENPLNNDPDNLEVIDHREHTKQHNLSGKNRKYHDKQMTCPICKKEFTWTARQQSGYDHMTRMKQNTRKYNRQPPCCSKRCAGIFASLVQYGNANNGEELKPKKVTCPICNKSFVWSYASQRRFALGQVQIPQPCCSRECVHEFRSRLGLKNK